MQRSGTRRYGVGFEPRALEKDATSTPLSPPLTSTSPCIVSCFAWLISCESAETYVSYHTLQPTTVGSSSSTDHVNPVGAASNVDHHHRRRLSLATQGRVLSSKSTSSPHSSMSLKDLKAMPSPLHHPSQIASNVSPIHSTNHRFESMGRPPSSRALPLGLTFPSSYKQVGSQELSLF